MSTCRGVRGATTCEENSERAILEATGELLERLLEENAVAKEDIAAVFFTSTDDLDAAFPAAAARRLGLVDIPLLGGRETTVPGAPARCIRVLVLVNTDRPQGAFKHLYLRDAQALRPDLAAGSR